MDHVVGQAAGHQLSEVTEEALLKRDLAGAELAAATLSHELGRVVVIVSERRMALADFGVRMARLSGRTDGEAS